MCVGTGVLVVTINVGKSGVIVSGIIVFVGLFVVALKGLGV